MTDCFALLEEARQPWLDPDQLKTKFHSLSAEAHPDRVHNASAECKQAAQDRYTELNAAYNCLREPKTRLRHLLELELGTKPAEIQQIPPDLMNLFMQVSQLCRETDSFLVEKAQVTSPLLRVELFERGQARTEKLSALQKIVTSSRDKLLVELKTHNAAWTPGDQRTKAPNLSRLEELYRLFSYFDRWNAQLQERIVQLAL
jgi:DnaJ-domain-containing protein 1